jgi:hypothetical protein
VLHLKQLFLLPRHRWLSPASAVCSKRVHPNTDDCITQPTWCEWNRALRFVSPFARNSRNCTGRNSFGSSHRLSTQRTTSLHLPLAEGEVVAACSYAANMKTFHFPRHCKDVGGQLHASAALHLGKIAPYPLDRRLGGPQSWYGRCGSEKKNVTPVRNRKPDVQLSAIPTELSLPRVKLTD